MNQRPSAIVTPGFEFVLCAIAFAAAMMQS